MSDSSTVVRLSVVMIVKNEADNLRQSLPAVADWVDEIIILDSGSADDSQAVAEQYGAQWFVNTEWPGFGRQRQIAQSYANGDWILAVDADEIITAELRESIEEVIKTPSTEQSVVYGIRRIDCIFGHPIDYPLWRNKAHWRLYSRELHYNDNLVHESVVVGDRATAVLPGYMLHQTAATPEFWLRKRLSYAEAWANDRAAQQKSVSFFGIIARSSWAFVKQYFVDGRFLKGRYGFIYATMFTHYTFNKYLMLFERNQSDEGERE